MRQFATRILDRRSTVYLAAGISLALGLFFTFVWAPHPWGWQGIDQYHDLAAGLARGEPFATTDVPWGYAYFAAAFYRLFGPHVLVPVAAQVLINAAAPLLLYRLVRPYTSRRVAVLASLITGAFSFNNVYASTQASDALCTVLFLAGLVTLSRAIHSHSLALFAVSGLLGGIVAQFRPNLLLLPGVVALIYVVAYRRVADVARATVYGLMVVVALAPWIARNYQLTGLFLPTSTHGGVQLWYGSLQVGPYLESRAHNPRAIFESAPFDYLSLPDTTLIVDAASFRCGDDLVAPVLVYWTDHDRTPVTVTPAQRDGLRQRFDIPGQPIPTAVYFYLRAPRPGSAGGDDLFDPPGGPANPYVWFVDDEHLRDIDRHDDVLDVFDVIRLIRNLAWQAPLPTSRLDLDGDGAATRADLNDALVALLGEAPASPLPAALRVEADRAVLELSDGSTFAVPEAWPGRQTDVDVRGALAGALASRSRTFTSLRHPPARDRCVVADTIRVNREFYRREPHQMRRYLALAADNISRDPAGFAAASAYRMVRLFIIRGTSDRNTAQQFSASRFAYGAGTVLSTLYFAVFVAGAWIAWRQRSALLWLLVPIAYVPLTICFVLTNMRYTVTMQPLMFVFVALAIATAAGVAEDGDAGGKD
jgi:hypothetical protein